MTKTSWKLSEYISELDKILKKRGDKEVAIGDMDSEGEIVGLTPAKPHITRGGFVILEALYPLGCFGDPNE